MRFDGDARADMPQEQVDELICHYGKAQVIRWFKNDVRVLDLVNRSKARKWIGPETGSNQPQSLTGRGIPMSQNRVPRAGSSKSHIQHYLSRNVGTRMSPARLQDAKGIYLYPNTTQLRSWFPGAFPERKKGIAKVASLSKGAINCNTGG